MSAVNIMGVESKKQIPINLSTVYLLIEAYYLYLPLDQRSVSASLEVARLHDHLSDLMRAEAECIDKRINRDIGLTQSEDSEKDYIDKIRRELGLHPLFDPLLAKKPVEEEDEPTRVGDVDIQFDGDESSRTGNREREGGSIWYTGSSESADPEIVPDSRDIKRGDGVPEVQDYGPLD